MNKLKYALCHGKFVLLILIIAIVFASSFINNTIMQINSAKNGIEVLLIDTAFTSGGTGTLEKDIKKSTGVTFVGAATLIKKDAEEYVKTIENYTIEDYIYYLTIAKNCEAIFVTESMLQSIYTLKNIVPLSIDGEFEDVCYFNGVLYAFPMKKAKKSDNVQLLQEDTYMILLNGDHVNEMRQYLDYLTLEAE